MKLLIVGGGGREHALAWKLKQDDPALDIVAAPGNPGIAASLGRVAEVPPNDVDGIVRLAESERVAVTVVGPEAPLAQPVHQTGGASGASPSSAPPARRRRSRPRSASRRS